MAERKSVYTDFKDPFHLLNELRNVGLERVYKNAFAYGNRDDMNMGYTGQPSSQVGRSSYAKDRLPIEAPMREMERLNAPTRSMPSANRLSYNVDYGNPGLDRGELKRLGRRIGPLADKALTTYSTISDLRKQSRAQAIMDPYEREMETLEEQIGQTKQNIEMGKGLLEMRTGSLTRQHQAQTEADALAQQRSTEANALSEQRRKARQREGLNVIARNIPEATTQTLSKVPGISPYGMLETPDETRTQRISQAMSTLFKEPSPLPPPSGMPALPPPSGGRTFDVPWSARIPAGASEPVPSSQRDTNTATLLAANQSKPKSSRRKLPPPPPQPTTTPPSSPMGTKGTKSTGTKSTGTKGAGTKGAGTKSTGTTGAKGAKGAGTKGPKGPKGTSGTTKKAKPPTSP